MIINIIIKIIYQSCSMTVFMRGIEQFLLFNWMQNPLHKIFNIVK